MPLLGKRITAAATAAAEKGARDEVRKVMERLLQPVVEKAMAKGVEVSAKGPGGIVLGSICLRIPDVAGGISEGDRDDLRELVGILVAPPNDEERESAIRAIAEILNGEPKIAGSKSILFAH